MEVNPSRTLGYLGTGPFYANCYLAYKRLQRPFAHISRLEIHISVITNFSGRSRLRRFAIGRVGSYSTGPSVRKMATHINALVNCYRSCQLESQNKILGTLLMVGEVKPILTGLFDTCTSGKHTRNYTSIGGHATLISHASSLLDEELIIKFFSRGYASFC